jgi:hypothetical protein
MERGRVGGEKNVQASPDLELGAPEPRKNRGPRRLKKSPGKGTGIRRLFPGKVQVSSQNFLPKTLSPWHQANFSGERRMGKNKKKRIRRRMRERERERDADRICHLGREKMFLLRFDADR